MTPTTLDPCPDQIAPLAARAVGALEPEAAARVQAHLAGCPGCAALAAELEAELDAARLPEEDPAPGGWERVLLRLDGTAPTADAPAPVVRLRCSYCHDDLRRAEAACCASCLAPHHPDCFAEHGRCAAPGCQETRVLRAGALPAPAARERGPGRGTTLALGVLLGLGGVGGMAAWAGRTRSEDVAALTGTLARTLPPAPEPAPEPEPTYGGQPLSHWIANLGDHSRGFRDEARHAVAQIGSASLPALLAATRDANAQRRAGALETFPELPELGQEVARAILASTQDPDPDVRRTATEVLNVTLKRLPAAFGEEALRRLAGLLGDDSVPLVRHAAAAALRAERVEAGSPAEEALTRALVGDRETSVRLVAAHTLLEVQQTARTVEALARALHQDTESDLRQVVAEGLDPSNLYVGSELLPQIARALGRAIRDDPSQGVAESAVRSMAQLPEGLRDAEALLVRGPELDAATQALANVAGPSLIRVLAGLAGRSPDEQLVGLKAVSWNRNTPSEELVEPLLAYLPRGATPKLRCLAASVLLFRVGAPRPPAEQAEQATRALSAVEALLPEVLELLRGDDDRYKATALEVIGQLGPRAAPAIEPLLTLVHEDPDSFGPRALEALVSVAPEDPRTLAAAAELLQSALTRHDDDPLACLTSVRALGPRAASLAGDLAALLESTWAESVRRAALEALTAFYLDRLALERIQPRLEVCAKNDRDARSRELAGMLLQRLAQLPPK